MAKLIQCNVPSTNLRKSRAFYRKLFGETELARSLTEDIEAYHQPISADGIQLAISPRQSKEQEITCYFAVDDLDLTLTELEQIGGTVVVEPFTLRIAPEVFAAYEAEVKKNNPGGGAEPVVGDIGSSAIIQDPDGNHIGLVQLRPQTHRQFKYGKHSVALDKDQVAQQERAIALGAKLKPMS